jgi:hypothetical protein
MMQHGKSADGGWLSACGKGDSITLTTMAKANVIRPGPKPGLFINISETCSIPKINLIGK